MADTGQEAWAEIYGDTLETQAGHGTMILQYYAYPPEITDDTPDDTALELVITGTRPRCCRIRWRRTY